MKKFLLLITALLSISAFADFKVAFKAANWVAMTGSPRYYQGINLPDNTVPISMSSFNQGGLSFYYARESQAIYWLNQVDESGNQTWVLFPGTTDDMGYIAFLPALGDSSLYWFVSPNDDPTPNEPIPTPLFDGLHGSLWWNRSTGAMFKMTSFIDNGDGTYTQTWTQIV